MTDGGNPTQIRFGEIHNLFYYFKSFTINPCKQEQCNLVYVLYTVVLFDFMLEIVGIALL